MLKALLWKEWREQRGIAFAGAAVALLIPLITIGIASAYNAPDFLDVADVVPFLFAMVVWPLFAALAGATVNSESASLASAGFLFSRPVPRVVLWLIKVAIGMVAIAFVVSLSFYVALRVDLQLAGWGFDFPFSSDPFAWPPDTAVQEMAVGALYVTFCGAIFLSTFLRRSVAAAMGGLALAVASQYGAIFASSWIGSSGSGVEGFLQIFSLSLAAVLLAASLYVFLGAGLSGSADVRRESRRAWVGIGLSLPFIVALAGFTSTRTDFDSARVSFVTTVPGTDTSIVSAQPNRFIGTTLWALAPGQPARRLTGRHARAITVSPDGEWLVYTSDLGALGTWSPSRCELRAVRIDGTEDRSLVLAENYGRYRCFEAAGFSPTRQLAALEYGERGDLRRLLITDLDRTPSRYMELRGIDRRDYWGVMPDWPTRNAILLYSRYDPDRGIWRVDVESGAIENVFRPIDAMSYSTLASSPERLLIREYERRDRLDEALAETPRRETIEIVELPSGATREIDPLCPPARDGSAIAAMTPDGGQVFYACRSGGLPSGDEWDSVDLDELFRGTLRRRDFTTGEDIPIAEFDSYVYAIDGSPDGSRFMVMLADPRAESPPVWRGVAYAYGAWRRVKYRYVMVDADGGTRPLEITPDWYVERWFGNDRLVLEAPTPWYFGSRALAYLEIHDGGVELRPLYQGGGSGQ